MADQGANEYTAPEGPDPAGMPDPMPDELQEDGEERAAFEAEDPTAGEAPSG